MILVVITLNNANKLFRKQLMCISEPCKTKVFKLTNFVDTISSDTLVV